MNNEVVGSVSGVWRVPVKSMEGEQLERAEITEHGLAVALPDSRCVMTTLAQDELPKDTKILRALTRHSRVQVGDTGQYPCAGVYTVVKGQGTIRIGDQVALAEG